MRVKLNRQGGMRLMSGIFTRGITAESMITSCLFAVVAAVVVVGSGGGGGGNSNEVVM